MMATYLINRLPTSPLNTTPLHKLFARDPDFSLMRVFGCACYPFLRPFNKHKLDFRSKQCVFLGISNMHRGYKCLDPSTNKIFVSRHVVFDEYVYPFSQLPSASLEPKASQAATTLLPFPLNPPSGSQPNTSSTLIPDHATMSSPPAISPLHSEITPSSPTMGVSSSPSAQGPLTLASADDIPAARLHQMRTRSQNHIVRPKSFIDGTVRYPLLNNFLTVCSVPETPSSYTEARKYAKWRSAMDDEFSALMKNGTWSLVPALPDMNVVGSMWVLKTKRRSDGTIDRRKARLVAKGYHQQHGIDFDDTFSPVVKPPTIRLVLSIAVSLNWEIHQIDIQNAFLHGLLAEDVYMHQPIGYVDKTFPNHVCKLHKALYGLKQAPRAWYSRLSDYLLTLGFITSSSDTSLFIYTTASTRLFLLVYVDDIVITGSSSQAITHLIQNLSSEFAVKDLGPISFFLGIEASRTSSGLFLSQRQYIYNILQRTNMVEAKPVSSPMSSSQQLSLFDGAPCADPSQYRSVVGALQYLSLTRPDISYSVNKVCQFMHKPTEIHWSAVKRILRYLKFSIDFGL